MNFTATRTNNLAWAISMFLLSLLLTTAMLISATAQEVATKFDKLSSPLTLTPAEKTQRDALLQEVNLIQRDLGTLFDQMLSTDDEDKALGIWYRAKARVVSKLKPANDKLQAWFETTRKAHKCEPCTLQGDTLVPAPLPGQSPAPAAPQQ